MNPRERMLTILLLSAVAVVCVGFVGYIFVYTPFVSLNAQKRDVEEQISKKTKELTTEMSDGVKIAKMDPRVADWEKLSLPDLASKNAGEVERHLRQVQVDYEQHINDILRRAGVRNLKITTMPVDLKSGSQGANKTPLYKKLPYKIEGNGSLAALVQALDDLHRDPLLHEVRDMTVTKPQTTIPGTNATDLKIDLTVEGLIVTNVAPREAEWQTKIKDKYENFDPKKFKTMKEVQEQAKKKADDPDEELPTDNRPLFRPVKLREDWLAVRLTGTTPPKVLGRDRIAYQGILAKNPFLGTTGTGLGMGSSRPEAFKDVLDVIKLTSVVRERGKWTATLTDPGKVEKGTVEPVSEEDVPETKTDKKKPPSFKETKVWIGGLRDKTDFLIQDMHGNAVLSGVVLDIEKRTIWFWSDRRIYRMHGNDTLYEAIQRPYSTVNIMTGVLGTAGAPKESNP